MRYFARIAFKGSKYIGWQKQSNALGSIQECFEAAFSKVLKTDIKVVGCGRTDALVHANEFYFHFDTDRAIKDLLNFAKIINLNLDDDLVVYEVFEVNEKNHARFSAIWREYTYHIHTYKNPFISELSSFYELVEFDIELANASSKLLLGKNDFRGFCKVPDRQKSTICHVMAANWDKTQEGYTFKIRSNRFLKEMVRIIVGRLLDVGVGKMKIEEFEEILKTGLPYKYNTAAFSQGLYLSKVMYRSEIMVNIE